MELYITCYFFIKEHLREGGLVQEKQAELKNEGAPSRRPRRTVDSLALLFAAFAGVRRRLRLWRPSIWRETAWTGIAKLWRRVR